MIYPNNTLDELKAFLAVYPAQKLLLTGDLWAGKTTLTKQRAWLHGIDPDEIKSPTYTYQQTYNQKILHIDMRRIDTQEDLLATGLVTSIDEYDYVVIERPKRTELYADSEWLHVHCAFDWEKRWLEVE